MKKVKIMLLAISLMAATGGLTAFKVMYESHYCITPATVVNGNFTCTWYGAPLTCDYMVTGIQTMDAGWITWDVYCYRQAVEIVTEGLPTYSCLYYGLELPCETPPVITYPE